MRRVLSAAKAFLLGRNDSRRGLRALALIGGMALAALTPQLAAAQASAPPVRSSIDENGVDLTSGQFRYSVQEVSIGQPGSGGLSYSRDWVGDGWRDNLVGTINRQVIVTYDEFGETSTETLTNTYIVSFGGSSESFELVDGAFVQAEGSQSTLTFNSTTQKYTYNNSGVVVVFDQTLNKSLGEQPKADQGRIVSVTYPTGETVTYTYKTVSVTGGGLGNRLQSVNNNLGYQLKFAYGRNTAPTTTAEEGDWVRTASVTGINGAVDYCDPTADSCTYSVTWPSSTYVVPASTNNQEVTDTLGRTTKYYGVGARVISAIRSPASPLADSLVITYDGSNRVSTISNGVGTWTYNYSVASGIFSVTKTDPLAKTWMYKSDDVTSLLLSEKDPLNRETTYLYDSQGRIAKVTQPEGDSVSYSYDPRGNTNEVRQAAKPGSGLSDIVTTFSYPPSCPNPTTCNLPTATADARGAQTEYTYDGTHGGVLTYTRPAANVGAARPQVRVTYSALYAWYKNSSGVMTASMTPVYRATGTSTCVSGSSCAATASELKATYLYGSSGSANNLLITSSSQGAGDDSLIMTTTIGYDQVGNTSEMDGPLSGGSDLMQYRYDAARQLIGVVSADPDGATVTLKNRATRYTYDADGQVTLAEQGTVAGFTDTDWASFAVLQKQSTTYDSAGRTTSVKRQAGSTTYAVAQLSYDNANRLECVAVRMNSFSSLPTSACDLSAPGANGSDRILRKRYDAAGQITSLLTGYGTSSQRVEATASYTANGQQATMADALGSLTTYEYDGFDRRVRIRYPNASTSARTTSSLTDYEEFSYDAASRVTQQTRRGGATFAILYDELNRITAIDAPGTMPDLTYTYDNFGRQLTASQGGIALSYTYNILGYRLSESGPLGTVSSLYDLAGNRTKLTWPDGFYVTYTYDNAGYLKSIRENGGAASSANLATFSYDNMGGRKSITRANGAGTSFGYDAIERPASMVQSAPGTANDITYGLAWAPNGQIKSRTENNSSFSLGGFAAAARVYGSNGLNQLTSSGSLSLTYDARGNLTSDGVNTYEYDESNRLVGMPSVVAITYDPEDRIYQIAGPTTTKFLYDGSDIIAEYNSAGTAVLRKYVHGPNMDEPLVWYEGVGTTNRNWLIADERGSVVAVTDGTGVASNFNKYDEYGIPDAGNVGRFQYTGQAWVPDLGVYSYKARFYSPTLGRFMQTDSVGYLDGLNQYAYVGNDPINRTDPSGKVSGVIVTAPINPCKHSKADVCIRDFIETGSSGVADSELIPGVDIAAILGDDDTRRLVCSAAQEKAKASDKYIPSVGRLVDNYNSSVHLNNLLGDRGGRLIVSRDLERLGEKYVDFAISPLPQGPQSSKGPKSPLTPGQKGIDGKVSLVSVVTGAHGLVAKALGAFSSASSTRQRGAIQDRINMLQACRGVS